MLVYPVRPGQDNEQLRYSLRSVAAYLPDAEVMLLGGAPSWVRGVRCMPYRQKAVWHGNVPRMIRYFTEKAPEEWVLMNDDFFALSSSPAMEVGYVGTMAQLAVRTGFASGWYGQAVHITRQALKAQGSTDPKSFDRVHRPLPIDNQVLGEALERVGSSDVLVRSLYGNTVGGVETTDAKVRDYFATLPEQGWVSTGRDSWRGHCGRALRRRFDRPSRFEA